MEFELTENNQTSSYVYFGYLQHDSVGVVFAFPEIKTRSNWHNSLRKASLCEAVATLGGLYYFTESHSKERINNDYGQIADIVQSQQFISFVNKWFDCDGALFNSEYFWDGMFGRFSSYGDVGLPDGYDDVEETDEEDAEDTKEKPGEGLIVWSNHDITIRPISGCSSYDDISGLIFILKASEDELIREFESILGLFLS